MRAAGLILAALLAACRTTTTPVERALAEHAAELRSVPGVRGEVRLRCSQADAQVLLDGVPAGRCDDFAGGLKLEEGSHALEVRKAGFAPWSVQVEAGGTRTSLQAELVPLR